jgi:hypothetical protein
VAVGWIGKISLPLVLAVGAVLAMAVCASGTYAGASSTHERRAVAPLVVLCDEKASIDPSGTVDGYRVVLGIVSVPPPILRNVERGYKTWGWPYGRKAGVDIHPTHKTVTVAVPTAWRSRVAIIWGNASPPVSTLKFQPCPYGDLGWNGYAGGFFLRKRRECVPLRFTVGSHSRTVRFGFDVACSRR